MRGKLWPMASPCLVVTSLLTCYFLLLSFIPSSLLFFSIFTTFPVTFPCYYCPTLQFFSPSFSFCLILSHQSQFHLIFRQWHWDLSPGSCSSADYRALLLERSSAHPWRICFQFVGLWCFDEAAGNKSRGKVRFQLLFV